MAVICVCVCVRAQFKLRDYCLIVCHGFREPHDGFWVKWHWSKNINCPQKKPSASGFASVIVHVWQVISPEKKKILLTRNRPPSCPVSNISTPLPVSTQQHALLSPRRARSDNPRAFHQCYPKTEARLDQRSRLSQILNAYYPGESEKA